jgi:hypothetical protein
VVAESSTMAVTLAGGQGATIARVSRMSGWLVSGDMVGLQTKGKHMNVQKKRLGVCAVVVPLCTAEQDVCAGSGSGEARTDGSGLPKESVGGPSRRRTYWRCAAWCVPSRAAAYFSAIGRMRALLVCRSLCGYTSEKDRDNCSQLVFTPHLEDFLGHRS